MPDSSYQAMPVLSDQQTAQLAQKAKAGDVGAQQQLVAAGINPYAAGTAQARETEETLKRRYLEYTSGAGYRPTPEQQRQVAGALASTGGPPQWWQYRAAEDIVFGLSPRQIEIRNELFQMQPALDPRTGAVGGGIGTYEVYGAPGTKANAPTTFDPTKYEAPGQTSAEMTAQASAAAGITAYGENTFSSNLNLQAQVNPLISKYNPAGPVQLTAGDIDRGLSQNLAWVQPSQIGDQNVQNLANIIQGIGSTPFLPGSVFSGMRDRLSATVAAADILRQGYAQGGNTKGSLYYGNVEAQALQDIVVLSSEYHYLTAKTGQPYSGNPFEMAGDYAATIMKGAPTKESEKFSPFIPGITDYIPGGQGTQQVAWTDAITRANKGAEVSFLPAIQQMAFVYGITPPGYENSRRVVGIEKFGAQLVPTAPALDAGALGLPAPFRSKEQPLGEAVSGTPQEILRPSPFTMGAIEFFAGTPMQWAAAQVAAFISPGTMEKTTTTPETRTFQELYKESPIAYIGASIGAGGELIPINIPIALTTTTARPAEQGFGAVQKEVSDIFIKPYTPEIGKDIFETYAMITSPILLPSNIGTALVSKATGERILTPTQFLGEIYYGQYQGAREEPLKTAAFYGIGFGFGAIFKGSEVATTKLAEGVATKSPALAQGLTWMNIEFLPKVLGVVYGADVAIRSGGKPETFGRIAGTEILPTLGGAATFASVLPKPEPIPITKTETFMEIYRDVDPALYAKLKARGYGTGGKTAGGGAGTGYGTEYFETRGIGGAGVEAPTIDTTIGGGGYGEAGKVVGLPKGYTPSRVIPSGGVVSGVPADVIGQKVSPVLSGAYLQQLYVMKNVPMGYGVPLSYRQPEPTSFLYRETLPVGGTDITEGYPVVKEFTPSGSVQKMIQSRSPTFDVYDVTPTYGVSPTGPKSQIFRNIPGTKAVGLKELSPIEEAIRQPLEQIPGTNIFRLSRTKPTETKLPATTTGGTVGGSSKSTGGTVINIAKGTSVQERLRVESSLFFGTGFAYESQMIEGMSFAHLNPYRKSRYLSDLEQEAQYAGEIPGVTRPENPAEIRRRELMAQSKVGIVSALALIGSIGGARGESAMSPLLTVPQQKVGMTSRLSTVGGSIRSKQENWRGQTIKSTPASTQTQYPFKGTILMSDQTAKQVMEQTSRQVPGQITEQATMQVPGQMITSIPIPIPIPMTTPRAGPPEFPPPFVPFLPSLPSQGPGGGGRRKRLAAFQETFLMGLDLSIGRPRKWRAKSWKSPKKTRRKKK